MKFAFKSIISLKTLPLAVTLLAFGAILTACDDNDSYSDLLNNETRHVNNFLADQRVINQIPADTVFETGPDAPFYRMDEDGNIYMQVIDPGTKGDRAEANQQVFFRYMRYNLNQYENGQLPIGAGNAENMVTTATSFRFQNRELPSTTMWGSAIQLPMYYLPVDCEVNLVVKSQYGITDEIASVIPYLYKLRYYRPQI